MIKNLFRFCLFSSLISIAGTSMAALGDEYESASCPVQVEKMFEPISQRFVLALLGANASVEFLESQDITGEDKDIILHMTPKEAEACSAPFPSQSYKSVQGVLIVLYTITVALWAMLVGVYAFASFYSKQSSGDSEQDDEGLILKFARSTTIMLICAPVVTVGSWLATDDGEQAGEADSNNPLGLIEYSPLHNILFRAIGYSIKTAEQIDASFKSHYAVDNPRYLIPEPSFPLTNKSANLAEGADGALDRSIVFGMCVQEQTDGERVTVDLVDAEYSNSDKHRVKFSYEGCEVTFSMATDAGMKSSIGFIKSVGKIDPDIDYPKLESATFLTLSKTLLDMSLGFSYGLYNDLLDKREDNLMSDDAYHVNAELEALGQWHEECSYDFDGMANLALLGKTENGSATPKTIQNVKLLAQSCLAKTITQKLGYPKNKSEDYDFDSWSDAKRLPLTYRQYQACSFSEMDGSAEDYQSCVLKVCGDIDPNSKESGIFECATLVDVARTSALDHYFDKLGFIASPAMMLNRLGDGRVPATAQTLLTSFKMDSVNFPRAATGEIKEINDILMAYVVTDSKPPSFTEYSYERAGQPARKSNFTEQRMACFINPSSVIKNEDNSITNCKHPINELHDLGVYMMKIYAGFVSGTLVRSTTSLFQGKKVEKPKETDGSIDEDEKTKPKQKSKASSVKKEASKGLLGLLGSKLLQLGLAAGGGGAIITLLNGVETFSFLDSADARATPFWYDETSNLLNLSAGAAAVAGYMMSGNIFDKDGKLDNDEYNKASRKVNNKMSLIAVTLLVVGFVLAFVIPVAPAAIFYATLISIFANILALVFSATYHVVYALAGTGKDVRKKLITLLNKWLLVMLRMPLLVVGFYLSYSLMISTLPTFALTTSEIIFSSQVSNIVDSKLITDVIQWFLSLIMFAIVMVFVLLALFDAITGPFYLTRGLVFSDDSGEALGKTNSTQAIGDNVRFFKNI